MHCKTIVQSPVSRTLLISATHTLHLQKIKITAGIHTSHLPYNGTSNKGQHLVKELLQMIDCHCRNHESRNQVEFLLYICSSELPATYTQLASTFNWYDIIQSPWSCHSCYHCGQMTLIQDALL